MTKKPVKDLADRSFKWLLELNENKRQLLKLMIPELSEEVDENSFELVDATFIGDEFSAVTEDVVFRAKLKKRSDVEVSFLVLVAHQSASDGLMSFRILKAMTLAWQEELRGENNSNALSLVIPILIHTGPITWKLKSTRDVVKESFKKSGYSAELVALLLRFVPDMEILYLDLSQGDSEKYLEGLGELGLMLSFYGAQHKLEEFRRILPAFASKIRENEVAENRKRGFLNFALQLTLKRFGAAELSAFRENTTGILDKEELGTMAESILDRVARETTEQHDEAQRQTILKLILKRFPDSDKAEALKRLNSIKSSEKLVQINERVLDWTDFEDIWQ